MRSYLLCPPGGRRTSGAWHVQWPRQPPWLGPSHSPAHTAAHSGGCSGSSAVPQLPTCIRGIQLLTAMPLTDAKNGQNAPITLWHNPCSAASDRDAPSNLAPKTRQTGKPCADQIVSQSLLQTLLFRPQVPNPHRGSQLPADWPIGLESNTRRSNGCQSPLVKPEPCH